MEKSEELLKEIKLDLDFLKNKEKYNWYTAQVYNGSELAVKKQIMEMNDNNIIYILAPYEEIISFSEKQKKKSILKKEIQNLL